MLAIQAQNLGKAYRIGTRELPPDSAIESLLRLLMMPWNNWQRLRRQEISTSQAAAADTHWALRDLSFDVREGEALAVIGKNGAGKSTLLKLLSRITEPTTGRAVIQGRVASLLEVGTGFHPELTGRENVYMNGTVLGMTKREIDRKFASIAEFAGVEKFLDTAVKRYSSGMKVRLAFSVAAHLDPEVLIIDEVLAVGDASFQKRCMDRMAEISREGRTILFVSHNLDLVDRLCQRAIVLREGRLKFEGNVQEAIAYYLTDEAQHGAVRDLSKSPRSGDGRARFVEIETLNAVDQPCEYYRVGETVRIRMTLDVGSPLRDVGIAVILSSVSGSRVITSWNREVGAAFDFEQGLYRCTCDFEELRLRPGHELWISLWMEQGGSVVDYVEAVTEIRSQAHDEATRSLSTDRAQGVIALNQHWSIARRHGSTANDMTITR
jgi:lipopolysaccharide transport system ATP-binding protein